MNHAQGPRQHFWQKKIKCFLAETNGIKNRRHRQIRGFLPKGFYVKPLLGAKFDTDGERILPWHANATVYMRQVH